MHQTYHIFLHFDITVVVYGAIGQNIHPSLKQYPTFKQRKHYVKTVCLNQVIKQKINQHAQQAHKAYGKIQPFSTLPQEYKGSSQLLMSLKRFDWAKKEKKSTKK